MFTPMMLSVNTAQEGRKNWCTEPVHLGPVSQGLTPQRRAVGTSLALLGQQLRQPPHPQDGSSGKCALVGVNLPYQGGKAS